MLNAPTLSDFEPSQLASWFSKHLDASSAPTPAALATLVTGRLCVPSASSRCSCAAGAARALTGPSSLLCARLAAGAWAWTVCGSVAFSSDHHECSDARLRFCKAATAAGGCHLLPPPATLCSILTRRGSAAACSRCGRQGEGRLRAAWALSRCNQMVALAATRHARDIRCAIAVLTSPSHSVRDGRQRIRIGSQRADRSLAHSLRPLTPLADCCLCLCVCLHTPIASAHFDPIRSSSLAAPFALTELAALRPLPVTRRRPSFIQSAQPPSTSPRPSR